jgi:DNA-binding MarR family transcriptional regulator
LARSNLAREGLAVGASFDFQTLARLSPSAHATFVNAFANALGTAFLFAALIAFVGFVLACLLPEHPLRETIAAATEVDIGGDIGQSFAMPTDGDPVLEVLRGLTVLADRDAKRRYIETIVRRAGLDLSPAAAWLLLRMNSDPNADPAALARTSQVPPELLTAALRELHERSLIVSLITDDNHHPQLTPAGQEVCDRLVNARRTRLEELFAEWSPESRADIAAALRRIANELVTDDRAGSPSGSKQA